MEPEGGAVQHNDVERSRSEAPGHDGSRRRIGPFQTPAEAFVAIPTLIAVGVIVAWFVAYVMATEGAERVSALFAAGLVGAGALLLTWSFVRRPAPGEPDDFLDKLLAGTGEALLLGAVLSFGFGIVGQQLSDERTARDLNRDLASQVRSASDPTMFAGVDLSRANLRGLDLSGYTFRAADLSNANLLDTSLRDANLIMANLHGANLGSSDLTGALLNSADLSGAVLNRVDFARSSLEGADLSGASLPGAQLADTDLSRVRIANIYCDDTTTWPPDFDVPTCLDPREYRRPGR
jgi:hypothetical protein